MDGVLELSFPSYKTRELPSTCFDHPVLATTNLGIKSASELIYALELTMCVAPHLFTRLKFVSHISVIGEHL
jgi:hypothetical protein